MILYKIKCVNKKSLSVEILSVISRETLAQANSESSQITVGKVKTHTNNSKNGSERSDVQLQLTRERTPTCEREAPVHGGGGMGSINTAANVEIKLI